MDSIGGHMDAFTAKEYASFHLKILDEHLPLAVDILGDIVMNPLFDPVEMAREKKVIFEEILRRIRHPRFEGEVSWLRSNFINGIKSMPIAFDVVDG